MRIVVIGPGGVGGLLSALLAKSGADLTVVARGPVLEVLRERGFRVQSSVGNFETDPVRAAGLELVREADLVLVAVKAWQVPELGAQLLDLLPDSARVLPLQNGVEAVPQLVAQLGESRVWSGHCYMISEATAPGDIRHLSAAPKVVFGPRQGEARDPQMMAAAELMRAAGIDAVISENIEVATWEKFCSIAGLSGIGAVTRAPIGITRTLPQTRALLRALIEETWQVARARGVLLATDFVERTLLRLDGMHPDATSSMQRDIMAGRPSELESKNGSVVRLGRAANVATPANSFVYAALLPQEEAARRAPPKTST